MFRNTTIAALWRTALLLTMTIGLAGCELIGNIFQAGFVVGIILVLLLLGVIGVIVGRFRR
jgi:hypothetical protein